MERINEEIARITKLLLEINEKGEYTTFLNLSGHVHRFYVRIYKGLWNIDKIHLNFETYYDNSKDTHELLELRRLLEDLKENGEIAFENRPNVFKEIEVYKNDN